VIIQGFFVGGGNGTTKKMAEQEAAKNALHILKTIGLPISNARQGS
jgi:dsRNA-specific ribonuclease